MRKVAAIHPLNHRRDYSNFLLLLPFFRHIPRIRAYYPTTNRAGVWKRSCANLVKRAAKQGVKGALKPRGRVSCNMVRREKKQKYRLCSSKVSEVSTKNYFILELILEKEICQTKNKKKVLLWNLPLSPSPHPFLLPDHNWGNKISIPPFSSLLLPFRSAFCWEKKGGRRRRRRRRRRRASFRPIVRTTCSKAKREK